jgi:hypothetical protein
MSIILYLGIRLRYVVSFTTRPLYSLRSSSWYPLDRRLNGLQSRYVRSGVQKYLCGKTEESNFKVQARGTVLKGVYITGKAFLNTHETLNKFIERPAKLGRRFS